MGNCCRQVPNLIINEIEARSIANWDGKDIVKQGSNRFDFKNAGPIERNYINYIDIMTDPKIKPSTIYYKKQQPDFKVSKFEDTLFPANSNSIIMIDKTKSVAACINNEDTDPLKNLQWLRPGQVFKNGQYKIYDKLDIEDIHQGVLGNCYFLSSLSAIAENPERLGKLIYNQTVPANGCYAITIYIQGKKKTIVVDDSFPVFKDKKRWAMASSGEGEIWVQLFEKIWAKVNQSYTMTIAGLPSEALSTLTEAPVITYIHKKYDENELWKIIKSCDDHNFIMCTTTNNSSASQEVGLVQSHAYTLVSAYQIDGLRLLKIRNPWGKGFEWNGDFGDKSNKWTPELKKKVNFTDANDGIFFMTYEDFLKYYPYTFVCKFFDKWEYKFKKIEQKENDTMLGLRFKIDKPTRAIIGLHQKQERFYNKVPNYKPCYCKFFLVKIDGENYDLVFSNEGSTDKIYLDIPNPLEPGDYYIFSTTTWSYFQYDTCKIVFSVYSDNKTLDFIPIDRKLIKSDYLTRMIDSYINKNMKYKQISEKKLSFVSSTSDTDTGFFWLSFRNENPSDTCKISIPIKTNEFIRLISKGVNIEKVNGQDVYNLTIPPSSQELLLFEQRDNVWLCKMTLGNPSITWDEGTYDPELDRKFIVDNYKTNPREEMVGKDIFYSRFKKGNYLLIAFINNSNDNYMLQVTLKDMMNCSVAYPISILSYMNIKVPAKCIEFMKIVPNVTDIMDYKLVYSYENLSRDLDKEKAPEMIKK